jgi:hypothetical protein
MKPLYWVGAGLRAGPSSLIARYRDFPPAGSGQVLAPAIATGAGDAPGNDERICAGAELASLSLRRNR